MLKIHVHGLVFPLVTKLSLKAGPFTINSGISPHVLTFTVEVQKGVLHIECAINQYQQSDFRDVLLWLVGAAGDLINLETFRSGTSYTMVADTFVEPDGRTLTIVKQDPRLSSLVTAVPSNEDFGKVFMSIILEPSSVARESITTALEDLAHILSAPGHTPTNCARVLDAIKNVIAPDIKDSDGQWAKMRDALNVDAAYLKYVTDHSESHRHGNQVYIDRATQELIASRTWTVMNRFLEYRKRGSVPLPRSEFELLAG